MDVSKLPPGLPTNPPDTPLTKQQLAGEIATAVSQDLQDLEKAAPTADHADIRPLDITGGLQIFVAETRAAFELTAESIGSPAAPLEPVGGIGDTMAPGSIQAAREIVEFVLQSLPTDAGDAAVWTAALVHTESALQLGLQQAVSTVATWRDVPDAVVDAVKQSGALVLQVLSDERPNPLWLRPEWVGLAPRLERFWRRRRAARRRLTDPDHWQGNLDDHDEQRR
jgi:hypothetical protein